MEGRGERKELNSIELNSIGSICVEEECKLRPGNVLMVGKNPKKYAGWGNL